MQSVQNAPGAGMSELLMNQLDAQTKLTGKLVKMNVTAMVKQSQEQVTAQATGVGGSIDIEA